MDSQGLLTIGQAVAYLRRLWPDVTASKLRYWEREGLIRPRRSPGGHRLYCPADLHRLHMVIRLRGDRRLPVRQVRDLLQRAAEDTVRELTLLEELALRPALDDGVEGGGPVSRARAARMAGIDADTLQRLERLGLVTSCPRTGRLDEEEVQIARLAAGLLQLGLLEEELAEYVRWAEGLAEREQTALRRLVGEGPCRASGPEGADAGEGTLAVFRRYRELAGPLVHLLYTRAVRRRLAQLCGRDAGQ